MIWIMPHGVPLQEVGKKGETSCILLKRHIISIPNCCCSVFEFPYDELMNVMPL
jgi:hypothetical protein